MAAMFAQADFRRYTAEAIGAFFLTMGGMLVLISGNQLIAVAAAHGAILGLMIYAFGPLSGGHFNPAVSFALFVQKKLAAKDLVMYMAFQIIGATVGAVIAVSLFSNTPWSSTAQAGATIGAFTRFPGSPTFSPGQALVLEILMTFMLATTVSVVVAGGQKMESLSGALIGGTLFACILWGGALTGASLNPARSLGPAFASGTNAVIWASIWLYIVGPLLGGLLAALVFMWFRGELKIHIGVSAAAPMGAPPPSAGGSPAPPPPPPASPPPSL